MPQYDDPRTLAAALGAMLTFQHQIYTAPDGEVFRSLSLSSHGSMVLDAIREVLRECITPKQLVEILRCEREACEKRGLALGVLTVESVAARCGVKV